ncbi:MAG: hypothetical protein ACRDTG_33295 [Pseudonocardiaceae bacterium]
MKLRPFSDHQRGVFVSVDGPSGAGKSTIVHHLAQLLVAAGEDVHVTAEPNRCDTDHRALGRTRSAANRRTYPTWP